MFRASGILRRREVRRAAPVFRAAAGRHRGDAVGGRGGMLGTAPGLLAVISRQPARTGSETLGSSIAMVSENTARLAVLIDADNAQPSLVEGPLAEVAKFGTPHVNRAYGA